MQILINTDHNIDGHAPLHAHVTQVIQRSLQRFSERITRVEVHLSDENAGKSGPADQRCLMEARIEGRQPIAVKFDAASLHQAIDGAAQRLLRAVDDHFERQRDNAIRGANLKMDTVPE